MQDKSPIELAADAAGGAVRLADLIGVSIQTLSNWRGRGVPIERCVAIENALDGAVTRRELRPDDWQSIWPELAEPDAEKARA